MHSSTFDYCGYYAVQIDAPMRLLGRIAANLEGKISPAVNPDCIVRINESSNPVEIRKDKRFDYASIKQKGTKERPLFLHYRYDTHVRTIAHDCAGNYQVKSNVAMDENGALICIRNYMGTTAKLANMPLLHASLVNINGNGTLITGTSMQGKTTMTTYLLEEFCSSFVGDENILVKFSDDQMTGLYVPRTIRVRFPIIAKSRLAPSLKDISLTDATQYLDHSFIEQKLSSGDFTGEFGLAFSRRAYCGLLGTTSQSDSKISTVIFTRYKESPGINRRQIAEEEGIRRLGMVGLAKKSEMSLKELEDASIDMSAAIGKRIKFIEVAFSGIEDLQREKFLP